MKTSMTKIATALLLSTVITAPTFAAVDSTDVFQSVSSVLGTNNTIFTSVDDGVVTLTGKFEGASDKAAAINAAERVEGVKRVIDLTSVSH